MLLIKKYLILIITFHIFTSIVYSQNTTLTIVGKKISVSETIYPVSSLIDTVTNFGEFIDPYTKEKVDTILIVKIIDPVQRAIYTVSEVVIGEFKKDTINFIYHDRKHIFSSKNVLLFFRKAGQEYILKQQAVEVYKTRDNHWACLYSTEMINKYPQIKFQKMKFKPKLFFDVSMYDDEYVKKHYPSPYYKVKKQKAYAIQGVYAEKLSALFK
jgi:hypothetical protein